MSAALRPAGPAPTIMTSYMASFVMHPAGRLTLERFQPLAYPSGGPDHAAAPVVDVRHPTDGVRPECHGPSFPSLPGRRRDRDQHEGRQGARRDSHASLAHREDVRRRRLRGADDGPRHEGRPRHHGARGASRIDHVHVCRYARRRTRRRRDHGSGGARGAPRLPALPDPRTQDRRRREGHRATMTDAWLGPRAVADAAGVSPDRLRHYERLGLLPHTIRTRAGYRRFPPDSIERVLLIQRALTVGFSLRELAAVLERREKG